VNLISRRAGAEPESEALINRSTRGATDAVLWHARPLSPRWGLTLLAGGHWHQPAEVDEDGWADLPKYARGVLRPRVSWDGGDGRTFFATTGVTVEDRSGGTMPGMILPAAGGPYVEALDTRRFDVGAVGQALIGGRHVVAGRLAFAQQRHVHRFGEVRERDRHTTGFGEVTVRGTASRNTWVAGIAVERDAYRPNELGQFSYTFTTPGVFAQNDVDVSRWLSLSASARLDHHSEYRTFFSPRLSALVRSGPWASRISVGTGFFGSSPLTEETESAGLSRLGIPRPLRAEEGRSASVDLSRTDGPLSYTVTLFTSRVRSPIHVERSAAGLVLTNLSEPASSGGMELLGVLRQEPFAVTATYTYVRAREVVASVRQDVPLTPRHSGGVVGMWEREDAGRIGIECYFTGAQRLEENPYRDRSEQYVVVGVLAEKQIGRLRLFINGENLNDVRQTDWDPLVRPARAGDGRWTVDAWAPLEGRNINGGVRLRF
jgi:iron complex outermembrane receptor protein